MTSDCRSRVLPRRHVYTNADGVLNDDAYDYDAVALPFFADLAEATVRWLIGDRLRS